MLEKNFNRENIVFYLEMWYYFDGYFLFSGGTPMTRAKQLKNLINKIVINLNGAVQV